MGSNRTRKTDNYVPSQYIVTEYNPSGSVVAGGGTYTSGRQAGGSYKSIDDVYDKDYFKKRNRGEVVLHDMTLVNDRRTSEPSNWFFGTHPLWGARQITGDLACELALPPTGGGFDDFDSHLANAADLALVEAYAKMKSPDVLAGVIYRERGKTATMVRNPFERARDQAKRVLNRKAKLMSRGMAAGSALANAWLEMRFGWRPLIADIAGIAKAATHVRPPEETLLTTRGGTAFEFDGSYSNTYSWAHGVTVDRDGTWHSSAKASAGVLWTLGDVSEAEWRNHCLGLSLSHVPSTMWELMPWSFVWDYFNKAGMWLAAITPNPYFEVKGNWTTTVVKKRQTSNISSARLTVTPLGPHPETIYYAGGGSYSEEREFVTRVCNRSLPATPPMAGQPLSFSQTVDITTLLYQQVIKLLGSLRHRR